MSYFKEFTFFLGCKYNGKNNLSSCINDETCLYCQFANCSIIQGSANVRQASKAWTVRFLANAGGEQKFNLWQSCKILLALTIFSKMFLWLQIWDRLRLPVLLLLQELSRLRLGDRRVSVQPGQSWWHVFVKEVTCICQRSYMYLYLVTWLWPHGSGPRQCKVPPTSEKITKRTAQRRCPFFRQHYSLACNEFVGWQGLCTTGSHMTIMMTIERRCKQPPTKSRPILTPPHPGLARGKLLLEMFKVELGRGLRSELWLRIWHLPPSDWLDNSDIFLVWGPCCALLCCDYYYVVIIFLAWNSVKVVNTRWMHLWEGLHW